MIIQCPLYFVICDSKYNLVDEKVGLLRDESHIDLNGTSEPSTSSEQEEALPNCGKLAKIDLSDVIKNLAKDEENPTQRIPADSYDRLINEISR